MFRRRVQYDTYEYSGLGTETPRELVIHPSFSLKSSNPSANKKNEKKFGAAESSASIEPRDITPLSLCFRLFVPAQTRPRSSLKKLVYSFSFSTWKKNEVLFQGVAFEFVKPNGLRASGTFFGTAGSDVHVFIFFLPVFAEFAVGALLFVL